MSSELFPVPADTASEVGPHVDMPEVLGNEVVDPSSGEIIDLRDVDAMAAAMVRITDVKMALDAAFQAMRTAIASMAPVDGKGRTRRVYGHRYVAVVALQDDKWDQEILREAYDKYTSIAKEVVRVEERALRKREWDKWERANGTPEFEAVKAAIVSAKQAPTALPTVKIEEKKVV